MNLINLIERLNERERELTEIRWSVPYGYLKTIKKINKVTRLRDLILRKHQAKLALIKDTRFQKEINIALQKWKNNKRFMSLDIERTEAGEFHEVGITMVQGRRIESFNYRIRDVERGPQFIFGKTIVADVDIVKNLIMLHASGVDNYIGHDFRHDLDHLAAEGIILPSKFYYDTSSWGKAIKGYRPKLYDMAEEYKVGCSQMHCGGNDARYTAEIFLKMINMYGE